MSKEMTIEVQSREAAGSGAARRLRHSGSIPAVVYGGDSDSKAIQVPRPDLIRLLKKADNENAVFLLKLAGSDATRHCMVKEMEVNPMTREIQHVDFLRIDMKTKVDVMVHVELTGEPVGVENEEGILDHITREIEIACLPGDIPRQFEIDVSGLHMGQNVTVGDIELPEGVDLLSDPERVVASVVAPRMPEEEEEDEDELLLEAEGEEPEVVGKGGKAEEGEEGEEGEEA